MNTLEANLDSSGNTATDSIQAAEIISRMDDIMNNANFFGKSNITHRNLRGILKAYTFNKYLENLYGFRIETLDKLADEKLKNVLSVAGFGGERLINALQSIKTEVRAIGGVELPVFLLEVYLMA